MSAGRFVRQDRAASGGARVFRLHRRFGARVTLRAANRRGARMADPESLKVVPRPLSLLRPPFLKARPPHLEGFRIVSVHVRFRHVVALVAALGAGGARAALAQRIDPLAPLTREIAAAQTALPNGERQVARSHYRSALLQGWMVAVAIASTEGRLADARATIAPATIHPSSSADREWLSATWR